MPQSHECLNIDSDILQFQYLYNNTVALYTQNNIVLYIDTSNNKTLLRLHLKQLIDATPSCITFSTNAKLLAIATNNEVLIISTTHTKIVQTIQLTHSIVSALAFDPYSKHIFITTHEGRVFQYNIKSSLALSRVCSFSSTNKQNAVSVISVYENKFACANGSGELIVIDFDSFTHKQTLHHNKVNIRALCFTDPYTLVSGNKEGTLYINSLLHNRCKQIQTPSQEIQHILRVNSQYVIFSSKSKHISLVDIQQNKLVSSKFLSFENRVKFMSLQNNNELLIVLHNNKIIKNDFANTDRLKSLIMHNSLDSAFELTEKNKLLCSSQEYKELQTSYTTLYMQALQALMEHNKALALQLTEMFQKLSSKQKEIRLLFEAFNHYERFKTLVKEEKYYIAYPMSEKFPALQYTPEYKKIKEQWKQSFVQAQKHMLKNKTDDAKKVLNRFMNVATKQALIKLLLNNNKDFLLFLQAVDRMQFQKIELLSKKNKIFLQTPILKTLEEKVLQMIQNIETDLLDNRVTQATRNLNKLNGSLFYKAKLFELEQNIKHAYELEQAYANSDFLTCYELIDTHLYLKRTQLAKLLQKHWSKLIAECEIYALEGDIQGIKATLGELLGLSTRLAKTGDLLRIAFRSKILQLIKTQKYQSSENFIYSYIDIFTYDNEIRDIMKNFELQANYTLALTLQGHKRTGRDNWIHSSVMN